MTAEEFDAKLQAAYPKAVDFLRPEYDADASAFELIASARGYMFKGYRLERAVFSTKPGPLAKLGRPAKVTP